MRLVFDLETDNLLKDCTTVHCAAVQDLDSDYSELFVNDGNGRIGQFLDLISGADHTLIGHNIITYDLPVLEKLYDWKPDNEQKIEDTFILGQLLFPDMFINDTDNSHGLPGKVFQKKDFGSHSLRAWGQRINCFKGEYKLGFESYNDEMGKYCVQDVKTTAKLFTILNSKIPDSLESREAIDLEYSIAPIIARQSNYGILFDRSAANELLSELTAKSVELKWKLQEIFKPKIISLGEVIPKRSNKKLGTVEGCSYTKIKLQEFNPNSKQQLIGRLKEEFGWDPTEFTEKGNPKLDGEIIDALPFKELAPLKEYLLVNKRIGQLESGPQAWLRKIDKDGRIRGAIKQNGAVTGRMTHHSPNLAQVPSNEVPYGPECRKLFVAGHGRVLVGCDADSLEMRCLAGYLHKHDSGRLQNSVIKGNKEKGTDPHTINMNAYGITNRDCAKTEFYADIYGARNAKKGQILLDYSVDLRTYVSGFDGKVSSMVDWAIGKGINKTKMYWECWVAGEHLTKLFGDTIPEIKVLREKIKEKIDKVGYIKGLDGRKLFCRSEHSQLNTMLQSAGAIIMKKALHICDTNIQKNGLIPGKDYEFVLNIHDEFEIECVDNENIIGIIKREMVNSIKLAGEYFKFPCPMTGNAKVGKNWAEVH